MSLPAAPAATVAELVRGLAAKRYSSVELTRAYLDRVAAAQPELNAFITVTGEAALAAAARADEARAAGRGGPLTGVPLAHKDIFCTEGVLTTCGSKMLANFVSPYDATVVAGLRQAGTVMLGKLNMDEFAMGSSNETSYFGPVRNPWDTARVPGGSSGGSAAAVAARIAPAATATDTGGSIRQPAALCGVTGIKPTYGRVSRYGMIAFASSLDQGGLITVSAEDAALLLGPMSGFDPRDSTSVDSPVPDYTATLADSLDGLTIGLVKEFFDDGLDAECGARIREAIAVLEKQGARVREVSCPNLPLSVPTYYVVAPAECSSNLARFDAMRYGLRVGDDGTRSAEEVMSMTREAGFGSEVKRRIILGTYALSAGYYDAFYGSAQKVRTLIQRDLAAAFAKADVLVSPTAPTTAFKFGEKIDDPLAMYLNDIATIPANLAGIPGMSIPNGLADEDGLPSGLQILAPAREDARLYRVGAALEAWHEEVWGKRMIDFAPELKVGA